MTKKNDKNTTTKIVKCFILLSVLFVNAVNAQSIVKKYSPFLSPEHSFYFHRLTVNDGLSQGLVTFMLQDCQGFMWFGTAGGLDRFDGYEFKTYNNIKDIPKQPVYFLSCLTNNDTSFWIGTELGLLLFDPVNPSGKLYEIPKQIGNPAPSSFIENITRTSDSTLLFDDAGSGLIEFNTVSKKFILLYAIKKKTNINPDETFAGIVSLGKGKSLIVTSKQILTFDSRRSVLRHVLSFSSNESPSCLYYDDKAKAALLGTLHGILKFKNGKISNAFSKVDYQKQLDSKNVRSIFKDRNGNFWIGTDDGVIYLDNNKKNFVSYSSILTDPSTIQQGPVIRFYEDKSENLWMSILDAGVCHIDLKKKKFFEITNKPNLPRQLPGAAISDIDIDKQNNLWLTGGGLTYIDRIKNKIIFYSMNHSNIHFTYSRVSSFSFPINDTTLCFIAKRKVYTYNIKTEQIHPLIINKYQPNMVYRGLNLNSYGSLLLINPDSIYEVNVVRKKFVRTLIRIKGQRILPVTAAVTSSLEDSAGNIWIGTDSGLLHFDKYGRATRFISDTSYNYIILPDPCILSLAAGRNGILWIGTISGLYRYDPQNQTMRGFHEQDGLHNTKIWNIAVDHNDNIWAGTNKGLIKLYKSRNGLYKIRTYNIEDGLPSNEFNMGVVTADNEGYLYFGTSDGIIFFNPDSMEDNKYEPKIAITALKIYGVPVSLDKDISFKKRLTIPFDKKVFSISFAALDYTSPFRNHYSYKLEGYDDVWIDAGSRREAFFTNLDPGKYTLLIKASNNDNVWTSKPLAVSIEIVPPFWLTWWFKGLVALAVILAIGGSIRYIELQKIKRRIEILERQQSLERERSRISKDMHDEIGANLTRISLLSDVVISQAKEAKNDSTLHQISNFANDTIEKLDEIVWAVNPSNDNLKNLIAYIGEYAEGFFSSSEIKCRFNFPPIIPEIPLSSEKRHNFFLVVKEALNNVQKYSSAAYVTLTLLLNESSAGSFKFIIQDDGIGFDCDSVFQTCNGIRNMKERMLSNGGYFELKTKPGEGTEIILIINS